MGLRVDSNGEICVFNQSAFDNMSAFTFAQWIYIIAADNSYDSIGAKYGSGVGWECTVRDNPQTGYQLWRITDGDDQYSDTNGTYTEGGWAFVAFVVPAVGSAISIYEGTLTSLVSDITGTTDAGTGSISDDSAQDVGLVNRASGTGTGNARIGWAAIWDTTLTLAELKQIQYNPVRAANQIQPANLLLNTIPGAHGASNCVDLSGNAYNGTITNATVTAGPPIGGMLFGYDGKLPYEIAAVGNAGIMTLNTGLWGPTF